MNLPLALLTIRWMVRDTFRQSLASRLFWIMLGFNLLFILFCLSVRIVGEEDRLPLSPSDIDSRISLEEATQLGRQKLSNVGILAGGAGIEGIAQPYGVQYARKDGVDVLGTQISLGFGLFEVTKAKDRVDAVRFLQVLLGGAVADTVGIFLVLIWTAGFIPTFIEPNQVTVLLAKPVPRWSLFVGKFLGVLVFVGLQATIFVIGTWMALGICTGVFDGLYLLTIPLVVIHFGIFYSFSALIAVSTRSTVVCVFASILFWFACWGMNFGRHAIIAAEIKGLTPASKTILEAGYWIMPKPGDMSLILYDALQADGFSMKVPEFKKVQQKNEFHPELSILASLLFATVILGIAAREFHKMDY
jgi:ABC-type transport system involved in multi-copper enzyme maturation permease subunit